MTDEQIKEMLNGIINNGEKWECRPIEIEDYVDISSDDWQPYKLGDEIHADWEYRKVKTWLEEKLSFYDQDCESEYNEGGKDGYKAGATEVCKKILEEADNRFNHNTSVYSILEDIIKDLGIEL